MELYQLRYFQAVAEFGTLAKAAEELTVSQSAVSRAISLLEKEIGVELFTRRGRANELNRFGKAFLDASRAAQRGIDTAVASVRQLAGADGGTVALGFLHSLGVATVPALIRWHHDRFPSVGFELHQRSGQALLTDLSAGVTDVCLNYPMAFDETLDIKWEPLFTQQLYAVVDREHPLATRGSVGFDELADQPFVALNQEHTLRRIFDDACVRHGVSPDDCVRGNRHRHAARTHRCTIGHRHPSARFDTITRHRRNRRRRRSLGPTDRDRMDGQQISSAIGLQFPRQRAGMATNTQCASRLGATGSAHTCLYAREIGERPRFSINHREI